jgi:hypothetical protein
VSAVPSSDPHAWLRPFFAGLQKNPAFNQSARAHQFAQLCNALSVDHPVEAEEMRHWSNAAQNALLAQLATAPGEPPVVEKPSFIETAPVIEQAPPSADLSAKELSYVWRATKDLVEMHCVLQFLPGGTDVWLFEGDNVQRTKPCRDAGDAMTLAEQWRKEMIAAGWKAEYS